MKMIMEWLPYKLKVYLDRKLAGEGMNHLVQVTDAKKI